ncbi:MAG: methionyl-tRNA formyltransferase [Candidatus Paceibacterota bacterium]|jgi:methionyl-tRNA formyltransferase
MKTPPFVFFGTSRFSVILLEELKDKFNITPTLIVTAPDRPVGRKQIITPPPVKEWAIENDIDTFQPEKLKDEFFLEEIKEYELFIVASYGKIIPQIVLDLPKLGTINVHPSLLPSYRGASPIQNQILNNESQVGTTIMLMDAQMDHGPIISQKKVVFDEGKFPASYSDVEEKLAEESASLLAEVLPKWVSKSINPKEQDHEKATFTKIIEKPDGEINLEDEPLKNYLKYLAYHEWPKTFFFFEHEDKKLRAVISEAVFEDGQFIIKKVIPEGKKETDYKNFLK